MPLSCFARIWFHRMIDTAEKHPAGMAHAITGCELEKRVASARESYVKFKTPLDVVGTAEAYRNLAFDTYLRRVTLLSGSQFGSVGEILPSKGGPYFKVHEAGFFNRSRPGDGDSFWERNFGNGAEIPHLENPLNLDFKTPRVMIGSSAEAAGPVATSLFRGFSATGLWAAQLWLPRLEATHTKALLRYNPS